MTLVAGIDSSTQTCKVTVRDLGTGMQVREGKASHPRATIVHPNLWWDALLTAVRRAGGLDDVVDKLVPALQERGAYRTAYTGSTLREHLDLPPAPVRAAHHTDSPLTTAHGGTR